MSPDPRPAERYRPAPGPVRRAALVALAALAYAGAAGLTLVVLRDLQGWGVLGSAAIGVLVALLVVIGRGALSGARGGAASEPPARRRGPRAQGGPPPGR